MRKILYLITLSVLALSMILVGCLNVDRGREEDILSGKGVVKFIDLEGGFYGIIGENGEHYDPINLSQEFQVDGLPVSFKAKIAEEVVTIRMWGRPIEILEIEKRG